jgi:hypothetical protein
MCLKVMSFTLFPSFSFACFSASVGSCNVCPTRQGSPCHRLSRIGRSSLSSPVALFCCHECRSASSHCACSVFRLARTDRVCFVMLILLTLCLSPMGLTITCSPLCAAPPCLKCENCSRCRVINKTKHFRREGGCERLYRTCALSREDAAMRLRVYVKNKFRLNFSVHLSCFLHACLLSVRLFVFATLQIMKEAVVNTLSKSKTLTTFTSLETSFTYDSPPFSDCLACTDS